MLRADVRLRRGTFVLDAAFEMPAPGVVALFGRSGCGKTTLVNVLAGLLAPDAGVIELDGHLLLDTARRLTVPAERRRIGYVFQDARLFPHLSVAANLRYGMRFAPGAANGVAFDEVVDLLGVRALLGRRPGRLSGGETQRVAIGRALLSQPRALLLDEPLSAIDEARRLEILALIERLRDAYAIPILLVSHRFEEVERLADAIVDIDEDGGARLRNP